ncbi:sugar phosphate isomerase/epimerase [Chloroflexi bacterium TSY]|nr:sugar phosphate isomerase/epimerase [Chloroflexi bacterium TSY]
MKSRISFMSANYVAREVDYKMTGGWGQGVKATEAHFQPIESYEERLNAMLVEIRSLGFDAVDIWLSHLHWAWATDEHIVIAKELLQNHQMSVNSLAGGFGHTSEEVRMSCRIANALETDVLGGNTPLLNEDRAQLVAILKGHGVKLGIENHPEKTPDELLQKIGDGADGFIGAAVDTGWFGTQGYDAAKATAELTEHIVHMHLKDVRAVGAHETCRFGEGVVPLVETVAVLKHNGYSGPMCVEHEPEYFNPNEDCRVSLELLQGWLA